MSEKKKARACLYECNEMKERINKEVFGVPAFNIYGEKKRECERYGDRARERASERERESIEKKKRRKENRELLV